VQAEFAAEDGKKKINAETEERRRRERRDKKGSNKKRKSKREERRDKPAATKTVLRELQFKRSQRVGECWYRDGDWT
jgi:hypothetical protein